MKKLFFALVAATALVAVSCSKDDEKTEAASLDGRWEAPRFADTPEDIAFVAIFAGENLDLYVIPWGQHMTGTYTLTNDVVTYNIATAYQAYTDVTYDDEGNMASWSWNAGNLDAATLGLTEGYEWYPMTGEDLQRAKEDFGEFKFKLNGSTATSSLVGIEDLTFYRK